MKWPSLLVARFKHHNPDLTRVEWEVIRELRKGPRPAFKIIERVKASRRATFQVLKLLRERSIIAKRGEVYELTKRLTMGVDEFMWMVSLFSMLGAATTGNTHLAIFSTLVFVVSLGRARARKR